MPPPGYLDVQFGPEGDMAQAGRTKSAAKRSNTRVIVLSGSKGGCGKSTIARNVLVAAGQAGIKALGLDMDAQATLAKWGGRREQLRERLPNCTPVEVRRARVTEWEDVLREGTDYQLLVIDTAPSVEQNTASLLALCSAASFTLVPTGVSDDDIESVTPWMQTLQVRGVRAEFLMNKVNVRTRSFVQASADLNRVARVCAVSIPLLEEVHTPHKQGLTPLDYEKGKALQPLEAVWTYLRREVAL